MAKRSPNKRSLDWLRERGYTAEVVERRLPGCLVTKDLFGFADLLAVRAAERGVLAVQATTGRNLSARVKKILGAPQGGRPREIADARRRREAAQLWLRCGNRIEVHGWRLLRRRGVWEANVVKVGLGDFS